MGGSAKLQTTVFNDTFNILNQKQIAFYSVVRLFWAFGLLQLINRKRDAVQILRTSIEELMIENLTPKES